MSSSTGVPHYYKTNQLKSDIFLLR